MPPLQIELQCSYNIHIATSQITMLVITPLWNIRHITYGRIFSSELFSSTWTAVLNPRRWVQNLVSPSPACMKSAFKITTFKVFGQNLKLWATYKPCDAELGCCLELGWCWWRTQETTLPDRHCLCPPLSSGSITICYYILSHASLAKEPGWKLALGEVCSCSEILPNAKRHELPFTINKLVCHVQCVQIVV